MPSQRIFLSSVPHIYCTQNQEVAEQPSSWLNFSHVTWSVTRCRGWWQLHLQGSSYSISRDERKQHIEIDHKSFKNSTKCFLHFMYNDLHAFIPAVALKLQMPCKKSLCFGSHILERTFKNFVDNCVHANSVPPYLLGQREEYRCGSANQENWATHNWIREE